MIQTKNISSHICYEKITCHYILLSGHCIKYDVLLRKELLKSGTMSYGNPAFIDVRNCKHSCGKQIQVVISGVPGNNFITYNNREVIEEELFTKPMLKKMCVKEDKCFIIGGTVAYSISRNESEFEAGNTFLEHKSFGSNCYKKCSQNPILTNHPRGQSIVLLISSVSSLDTLMDMDSPQYKVAC